MLAAENKRIPPKLLKELFEKGTSMRPMILDTQPAAWGSERPALTAITASRSAGACGCRRTRVSVSARH